MIELSRGPVILKGIGKWTPSLYFFLGQIGWFTCVISAAKGAPWIGVALAVIFVTLHLLCVARPLEEIKLLASVLVIGGIWESALVFFGLLAYPGSSVGYSLAPVWILALWALFAVQFNTTYKWLKSRMRLAAVLGALAGPLSFRAGAALGALRFVKLWPATVVLAIGWAGLLLLIIIMSRRWDGVAPVQA
jgi:Protein of unknown function (DUF2878)